ncbi:hypothetical protein B0I08_101688 [Glaciihabitans tibetensis]|uniref:Uncharacterized protein n=1 Tax=Glaciihabitans tibetensis TaxID=1266600 RepID=A0A2T0VK14_9MICO|nr:hypothetical protein [Glaciihabitans tibetensis]PRY70552.1 hypothetical protein B0I08_101688 [Glaciihabitans tibetensis]
MPQVIARIIIDTDEWESLPSAQDQHPVMIWRKVESSHASPFSAGELNQTAGTLDDLYFG